MELNNLDTCRPRPQRRSRSSKMPLMNTAVLSTLPTPSKNCKFVKTSVTHKFLFYDCPICVFSYTQEFPLRFKKEIVKAAKKHDSHIPDDKIPLDGLQRVISNIDMEHKVSRADMETIFLEIGEENGKMITTDRFMNIL